MVLGVGFGGLAPGYTAENLVTQTSEGPDCRHSGWNFGRTASFRDILFKFQVLKQYFLFLFNFFFHTNYSNFYFTCSVGMAFTRFNLLIFLIF